MLLLSLLTTLLTIGAAGPPTLSISDLTVTLDGMLPRPRTVVYKTANLTGAVDIRATRAHEAAPSDMCLNTAVDVGCAGPAAKVAPNASAAVCCALCKAMGPSKCTAWTWNGPDGNKVRLPVVLEGHRVDGVAVVSLGLTA